MNHKTKIELLYFEDCPSWLATKQILQVVMDQLKIDAEITLKRIETNADAVRHKFPGSPTIRLDGKDLFPVDYSDFALGCRVYTTPEGLQGVPTEEMVKTALMKFQDC